jgi:alkylhydroperoxidase family enzyme
MSPRRAPTGWRPAPFPQQHETLPVTRYLIPSALAVTVWAVPAPAADPPTNEPRPTPLTRPEMKQFLEDMKARKPRIPLPELTEEDKKQLGDRANNYEARLRFHYMPGRGEGGRGSGFSFGPTGDEATLDNTFKVQLFWLVSRANNCQYCQGHQESKLLRAGQKEDDIAALDFDWGAFTESQKVAFAFARKFTLEPHKLGDADIEGLRKHYKDAQILEMILSMAGNNAINRWKEGVGVPQSAGGGGFGGKEPKEPADKHSYLTPTSDKFKSLVTKVSPVVLDPKTGEPTRATVCNRPELESRDAVEKALAAAAKRTPRLPLIEDSKAREIAPEDFPKGPLPQWVRLLATFPAQGKSRVASQWTAEQKGDLKPLLKAQVSWIVARQDRAWYATGEAKKRLVALNQTDDQIYKLDGDWKDFTPTERALFTVAKKLAASPVVLTDDDVAAAVKLAGARDVVQLVTYVTTRASFGRITEAAGLQIEK